MATIDDDFMKEFRRREEAYAPRRKFEKDFLEANIVVQIESTRLALLAMLERVRGHIELQEIEEVIDGLWSFSTDELFGFSAAQIQLQDYSISNLRGIYRTLRAYRVEWEDEAGRGKTYYMSAGVLVLLDVIRFSLSSNPDPAKYVIDMVDTAAYALEEEDPQIVQWFFAVFMESFYATKTAYEAAVRT